MSISFKQEPVAWVAAVHAIFAAAAGFGFHITTEQLALIDTALTAIGALIIRSQVYAPTDKAGNPITVTGQPMRPMSDEYTDIIAGTHPESEHKSQAQLLADYKERQRKYGNLPPPIVKAKE